MKSDRRHELQTNELASLLTQGLERYRSQLPTIGLVAVVVLLAVVAIGFWTSTRGNSTANAWQEYYQAANASDLKALAEKYPDTEVYLWARLDLADAYCFEGKHKLDTDRENGVARLREAVQIYAGVTNSPRARPEMVRRSALAEAKCLELLGERDKAIETYKKVADKYAVTHPAMAKEAASRASDLEQPDAADFYKWLSEYKPPTIKAVLPPDIEFPPAEGGKDTPSGPDDKPKEPSDEAAGPKDEKPSDAKESGDKPSEGESESKKPDAEKSVEPKPDNDQPSAPPDKPDVKKEEPAPSPQ